MGKGNEDVNVGGEISDYIQESTEKINPCNYNEVDGLVFAELSYLRYEDVEWSEKQLENGITIKQFATKLYNEKVYKTADERDFLESLINSNRFKSCKITDMEALNGTTYWSNGQSKKLDEDGQWAAMTIKISDDTCVVAMRGTNGTKLGWDEDFELAYTVDGTTAQKMSKEYLERVKYENINGAGHSKAGNDIIAAFVAANEYVRRRVKRLDTYDSPGDNEEFLAAHKEGYAELGDKLHNHYPEDSVIGTLLGDKPGDKDFCKTDTYGHKKEGTKIGEHDPFSWKVNIADGKFDEAEQSEFSKGMDRFGDNFVSKYDNKTRYRIVRLLDRLGILYLLDDGTNLLVDGLRILGGFLSLSVEDRMFLEMVLADALSEYSKEKKNNTGQSLKQDEADYCFYTNPESLKRSSENMEKLARNIDNIVTGLDNVKSGIRSCGNQLAFAADALERVMNRVEEDCAETETLSDTLFMIATSYELTERRIVASA